jgi:xanthine/uracil permease
MKTILTITLILVIGFILALLAYNWFFLGDMILDIVLSKDFLFGALFAVVIQLFFGKFRQNQLSKEIALTAKEAEKQSNLIKSINGTYYVKHNSKI